MKPGKIVQEVFGKDMEVAGYVYVKAHPVVWAYEKKVGDTKLMIAVMRDHFEILENIRNGRESFGGSVGRSRKTIIVE